MASDCAEEDGTNISAVSVGPFLTWFVTVRDGHWARRFGNRGLGRYWGLRGRERQGTGEIQGPEREGKTGDWGKLHGEELHGLCCSPSNIIVIK